MSLLLVPPTPSYLPQSQDVFAPLLQPSKGELDAAIPDNYEARKHHAHHNHAPTHRIIALVCTLLLSIGSHYVASTLGSLKAPVMQHLAISNQTYAIIQSSVAIVNTLLPVLGGVLLDTLGTGFGSVLATGLIALGNIIVALSTHAADWRMMVLGRIIYGLGSGSIMVVQDSILTRWFEGRSLAVTMGLQIAVSRLASFLAMATVYPVNEYAGWYGAAFWVGAALCIVSLAANLVYLQLLKQAKRQDDLSRDAQHLAERRRFRPSTLLFFPTSFWAVLAAAFLLAANWNTFLHINTDLVRSRYGSMGDTQAANVAALAQLVPVFTAPFLGYLHDRFGRRASAVSFAALLLSFSAYLLLNNASPVLAMLIFSASLALGPVALVASIPRILPPTVVGTALGMYKSAMNIGITLFDISMGRLQDSAGGGYDSVLKLYILVGIITAAISWVGMRRGWTGRILETGRSVPAPIKNASVNEYQCTDAELHANRIRQDLATTGIRSTVAWTAYVPIVVCLIALAAAWIVFIFTLL